MVKITETMAMEILQREVADEFKASIDSGESFFIPIEVLESLLDGFSYSTRNFSYTIFKDGYANLCVAASLELIINYYSDDDNVKIQRSFVGACNFSLNSLGVNTHFLATAKSECVKNAASDAGKYFGRGLNKSDNTVPDTKGTVIIKKSVKSKPDIKIMQQFADAVMAGDQATITMLTNIYEIKTEADATEEQNIISKDT